MPERPNPFTAAIRRSPLREGHGVCSAVMRTGIRSQSKSGCGSLKCRCAGTTPLRIASTAFITLAIPAAHSECPMLVFTEPTSSGRSASRPRPNTDAIARSSMASPRLVPVPCASR